MRDSNNLLQSQRARRAGRIVAGMAGILVLAIAFSTAVWWLAGSHTYDRLGVILSALGMLMILAGLVVITGRRGKRTARHTRQQAETFLPEGIRRRHSSPGIERDRLLMLYFCGVGLLCLFAGSLIILGL